MNSQLPSPFISWTPSNVDSHNHGSDVGVPGFVFLSQPKLDSPRNRHPHMQMQRGRLSSPLSAGPLRHQHFQQYNSRPNPNWREQKFNSQQHSSPNAQFVGHHSPSQNRSYHSNNSSPYHQNNDLWSPYCSPNSSYGHVSPFQSPASRQNHRGRGRGRDQGKGRGHNSGPLSDIPIEKFVSSSMFEDPWAPLISKLPSEKKQRLESFDAEFSVDHSILKATSVKDTFEKGPSAPTSVAEGTSAESVDRFQDSWQ
ncbi:uncharacterized protein LOC108679083 [Hyalella azteca]|uniref:Uncharacterized protein LOC108679083 n=1 Tax=Hyalella azteca TaxID=294128 RepID=A0A8B7PAT3_HYAAZ|nr:uncharacterized protein LOC108679083 [Hyalella azteca]